MQKTLQTKSMVEYRIYHSGPIQEEFQPHSGKSGLRWFNIPSILFPTNKVQVQGEVVLTSRQVEVINGCQLQDVEEAGEERHGSTDGGTLKGLRRGGDLKKIREMSDRRNPQN